MSSTLAALAGRGGRSVVTVSQASDSGRNRCSAEVVGLVPSSALDGEYLRCEWVTRLFLAMVVRYGWTMTARPELRWFTGTIPIWFHMVLAAFLFTLGDYHARRGSASGERPSP